MSDGMEFCWLVELFEGDGTGNSAGLYHTGFVDIGGHSRTTRKPHEARRYTREQAERVHRQMTDRIYELRREGRMGDAEKMMVERRPLNKLAPLRHSYACTVHKSQGSTYDVAFLDFPDIYRSRDMRARLLYVAATRPSQYLVISHTGA